MSEDAGTLGFLGKLDAIPPLLDCLDTRLWSPRETHWQTVIDLRDGCFVNLSASGQRQRMFRSDYAHPFCAHSHRDRILNGHALQTYPYVWFLAMLWFGRCADWSLDPDEYLARTFVSS